MVFLSRCYVYDIYICIAFTSHYIYIYYGLIFIFCCHCYWCDCVLFSWLLSSIKTLIQTVMGTDTISYHYFVPCSLSLEQ